MSKSLWKKLHFEKEDHDGIKLTGHEELDMVLETYRITDANIRRIKTSLQEYLDSIRRFGEKSASTAQSFVGFYACYPPSQESLTSFSQAQEKLDNEIIERLLNLANTHVLQPLTDFVLVLDGIKKELSVFREKQTSFEHYMVKLQEEQHRKGIDPNLHKTKEGERLTRNQTKLATAQQERDSLVASIINQLNHIERIKLEKINAVYKAVFQFQQELFKQSWNAINFDLPMIPVATNTNVNSSYQSPQNEYSPLSSNSSASPNRMYQGNTNSANQTHSVSDNEIYQSNPHMHNERALQPPGPPQRKMPIGRSSRPPPPSPAPSQTQNPNVSTQQPPQLKPRPIRKSEPELVNKWFGSN